MQTGEPMAPSGPERFAGQWAKLADAVEGCRQGEAHGCYLVGRVAWRLQPRFYPQSCAMGHLHGCKETDALIATRGLRVLNHLSTAQRAEVVPDCVEGSMRCVDSYRLRARDATGARAAALLRIGCERSAWADVEICADWAVTGEHFHYTASLLVQACERGYCQPLATFFEREGRKRNGYHYFPNEEAMACHRALRVSAAR